MSENLLGLGENPFAAGHDPRLIYPTPERAELLARFGQGLGTAEPFFLLTGEAGTGKTSVIAEVLAGENIWPAVITNPRLTAAELLEEICLRFGVDIPEKPSKPQAVTRLERHLGEVRREGDVALLVIDEAHDLSLELLEELRLLSNLESGGRPLLSIVLVGLPALEARLATGELEQLRQRVSVQARLHPLDLEGTERYIHHRVEVAGGLGEERFPRETCREIHRLTRGIPRAINTLAGQAILGASRMSERTVTIEHVQAAAADTWLRIVGDGAPPGPDIPTPARKLARSAPPAPEPVSKAPESRPAAAAESARERPAKREATAPPRAASEPERAAESRPRAKTSLAAESPSPAMSSSAPEPPPRPGPERAAEPSPRAGPLPDADPAGASSCHAPSDAELVPPRPLGESDVRAWVSKFVDPDRPIQIGSQAGTAASPFAGYAEVEFDEAEAGAAALDEPQIIRGAGPPRPRRTVRKDTAWLAAAALAVFAVAGAVVLLPRMRSAARNAGPVASRESLAAQARLGVGASAAAGAASPATADTAAGKPKRRFGVEVATYIDPYRARSESARLAEITGLSARVLDATDQGGEAYRIVLGSFGSRRRAEAAADDLISRGLVDQARVASLGKSAPATAGKPPQ